MKDDVINKVVLFVSDQIAEEVPTDPEQSGTVSKDSTAVAAAVAVAVSCFTKEDGELHLPLRTGTRRR